MAKRDYGGAFDIDPEQYYTRDDLNLVMEETDELLEDKNVSLTAVYIKVVKGRDVFDIGFRYDTDCYDHLSDDIVIDRRKAWTGERLAEVYAPIIAGKIKEQIKEYEEYGN